MYSLIEKGIEFKKKAVVSKKINKSEKDGRIRVADDRSSDFMKEKAKRLEVTSSLFQWWR